MFNIVKRRDFMLADDVPSLQEAERIRSEKYDRDHLVVMRASTERVNPLLNPPPGRCC